MQKITHPCLFKYFKDSSPSFNNKKYIVSSPARLGGKSSTPLNRTNCFRDCLIYAEVLAVIPPVEWQLKYQAFQTS